MRAMWMAGLVASLGWGTVSGAPLEWKLPRAEGEKWVARIHKAVSRDGWTVTLQGNDIVVQREKPVPMLVFHPNEDALTVGRKRKPEREQKIRFVFRFVPKMTLGEYERLSAINAESEREHDRLQQAVRVPHKFDEFVPTTPQERERVRAYREAVAKLPRYTLPDLYTPDHSIYYLHCWDGWSSPADKDTAAECKDVEETLMRLFGMYSPAAASRNRGVGAYLAEPRR